MVVRTAETMKEAVLLALLLRSLTELITAPRLKEGRNDMMTGEVITIAHHGGTGSATMATARKTIGTQKNAGKNHFIIVQCFLECHLFS